jgi:sugar phosphate isomerase/epimerase
MKVSILSSCYIMQYSLEETIRKAADAGYDAVDFLAAAPHAEPREFDKKTREQIRKLVESLGLQINQIATFAPPNSGSYADMEGHVKGQCERLDFAKDVGASHLEVVPGFKRPHLAKELTWKWAIEAHKRIVDHGEKLGIPVAVECEPLQPSQRMWGRPMPANVYDLDTLAKFIDEIGSPYCQANLDIGHCNILARGRPDTIADKIRTLKGRILGVHLNDNDGVTDLNAVPGRGSCDFEYYLMLLRDMGYEGFVSIELEGQEEPLPAAAESLVVVKETLDKLAAYG